MLRVEFRDEFDFVVVVSNAVNLSWNQDVCILGMRVYCDRDEQYNEYDF